MPVCPPISPENRAKIDRWELVVGKALKDWVTRVMKNEGLTRAEAREVILERIRELDPVKDWICSQCGLLHSEHDKDGEI